MVSGQINKDLIGVNRGILHEVDDQLEAIKQVTKWAHRILDPADVPEVVHEAFRHLKTGRPRPVELEIPQDTLANLGTTDIIEPEEYPAASASADDIARAAWPGAAMVMIATDAHHLELWRAELGLAHKPGLLQCPTRDRDHGTRPPPQEKLVAAIVAHRA